MALVTIFMFSLIGLVAAIIGAVGYDLSVGSAFMVYVVLSVCGPLCMLPMTVGMDHADPA